MLILNGCTPDKAAALLKESGGRLRTALLLASACSEAASGMPSVDAEVASAVPDKVDQK
jgi:hypothetical protein